MRLMHLYSAFLAVAAPALAQQGASLSELEASPVVTMRIGENLKSPPDEATVTSQSRGATASAALETKKVQSDRMLAEIKAAGIPSKDLHTQGVSLNTDYTYETGNGRGSQRLVGYIASNSVLVKSKQIDRLSALLDRVTRQAGTFIS